MVVTNTEVTWLSTDPFVLLFQLYQHSCCRRHLWKSSTTLCATWSQRARSPPGCSAVDSWLEELMHARWDVATRSSEKTKRHWAYIDSLSHSQIYCVSHPKLILTVVTRETPEDPWCVSRRVGSGSRPASWAGVRAALVGTSPASTRASPSWETGSRAK